MIPFCESPLLRAHFLPDGHGLGNGNWFGARAGIVVLVGGGKGYTVETAQVVGMGRILLA